MDRINYSSHRQHKLQKVCELEARKSIGLFVSGLEYTTDPQAVSQTGLTCAVDPFTNHAIRILAALIS